MLSRWDLGWRFFERSYLIWVAVLSHVRQRNNKHRTSSFWVLQRDETCRVSVQRLIESRLSYLAVNCLTKDASWGFSCSTLLKLMFMSGQLGLCDIQRHVGSGYSPITSLGTEVLPYFAPIVFIAVLDADLFSHLILDKHGHKSQNCSILPQNYNMYISVVLFAYSCPAVRDMRNGAILLLDSVF